VGYSPRVVMESYGIEMPTSEALDFTRAVSRLSERSSTVAFPVQVVFMLDETMFDHKFSCLPDYGELWKTLRSRLEVDTTNAMVTFNIYMDDVLLTNRNTLEMFHDVVNSASMGTMASVILTVRKQSEFGHPTKLGSLYFADSPKGSWKWVLPHVLYILVLLLLTFTLNRRMKSQEEKIKIDMTTIDALTSTLVASKEQQAMKISECTTKINSLTEMLGEDDHGAHGVPPAAPEYQRELQQQKATIENLTRTLSTTWRQSNDTIREYTTRIQDLTGSLNSNMARIDRLSEAAQWQSNKIQQDIATIEDLSGSLAAARKHNALESQECASKVSNLTKMLEARAARPHDKDAERNNKVNRCLTTINNVTVWLCASDCNCLHL